MEENKMSVTSSLVNIFAQIDKIKAGKPFETGDVLNLWAEGKNAREISKLSYGKYSSARIGYIIRYARYLNDPRAKHRRGWAAQLKQPQPKQSIHLPASPEP